MALGTGINPEKFEWLVRNVDPAPFFQAINQPGGMEAAPGGAMDMTGSAASPTGAQPQQGMDFNSVFGEGTPQAGGAGQAGMANAGMQMTQPQQQKAPPPAAAPRNPGMIDFPSAAVPRGNKPVPTLAELLRG